MKPDQRKCNLFDKYAEHRVKPRSNNTRNIYRNSYNTSSEYINADMTGWNTTV